MEIYRKNQININELMKNGDFSSQVDKYINGQLSTGDYLFIGYTPKKLLDLGLKNVPIILKQSKLKSLLSNEKENTHYHSLTVSIIKKIPRALENPWKVIKSSSQKNSIIIVTYLKDCNQRTIIAILSLNKESQLGNIRFVVNQLSSAYGKNNYSNFLNREISKGNLLYDDKIGIIKELPTN